jgi:hypothetical protein
MKGLPQTLYVQNIKWRYYYLYAFYVDVLATNNIKNIQI